MTGDEDRSGVLLLRAWTHDGEVVVRLRWSVSGSTEQHTEVVVGHEQVIEAVRRWVAAVERAPGR